MLKKILISFVLVGLFACENNEAINRVNTIIQQGSYSLFNAIEMGQNEILVLSNQENTSALLILLTKDKKIGDYKIVNISSFPFHPPVYKDGNIFAVIINYTLFILKWIQQRFL